MRMRRLWGLCLLAALALGTLPGIALSAQDVRGKSVVFSEKSDKDRREFILKNDAIQCSIKIDAGLLASDEVSGLADWLNRYGSSDPLSLRTDGDFLLDIMWTGWSAPGKTRNADNPVNLTRKDFQFAGHEVKAFPDGSRELDLTFKGAPRIPLELRLTFRLEPDAFYVRRKLAVRAAALSSDGSQRSSARPSHYLRWIWPLNASLEDKITVIKTGGFGQPAAFGFSRGGAFFGLEYPASETLLRAVGTGTYEICCGQEIGGLIGDSWTESEWTVEGLSPEPYVKLWFWKYVDSIRVAPLKPYLLYNSWYDLRAPEYVKIPERSLTEKNVLQTIEAFRKRMYEQRGLSLDAFVLDDGWDVYRSDWILNKAQFPNGFAPLAAALKPMGTRLGIWFGPTGGYSNRNQRIEFMKSHGYEVVGDQLCLAGTNYKTLLKKRTADFVRNDGLGYFKWDGIQFSCSEPSHGHPQDLYSRRAVMESLIEMARAVRAEDKNVFLNITSGTWLSPWWVKTANTIWMQGSDYGYADVPSISLRDGAITYRDSVLYDGLTTQDSWFPIANLMTHGIIKARLQMLGGKEETLDKFVTEVLLYLSRGIEMWELYISPDALSEAEWDALAQGIRWAKDRFDVLKTTEIVGGNPDKLEPYGFIHFAGKKGLLAIRNPGMEPKILAVKLSPAYGLDPKADNLVIERLFPTRWISPVLFQADSKVSIPLEGYETVIYEIYPLAEAAGPLLADATFDMVNTGPGNVSMKIYDSGKDAKLLNPETVASVKAQGKDVGPALFKPTATRLPNTVTGMSMKGRTARKGPYTADLQFSIKAPAKEATLAVLIQQATQAGASRSEQREDPAVGIIVNGKKVAPKIESQKGSWAWYKIKVKTGKHTARIRIDLPKTMKSMSGTLSAWVITHETPKPQEASLTLKSAPPHDRPLPPLPFPAGMLVGNAKIGEGIFTIAK